MPSNITDVDDFTAVVVSPEDGDFVTGASVRTGLQGVSNRTRRLKNRLDNIIAEISGSIITWTAAQLHDANIAIQNGASLYLVGALSDIRYSPARTFVLNLPMSSGHPDDPGAVSWDDALWAWRWSPSTIDTPVVFPLPLMRGATITGCDVMVDATPGHNLTATLKRRLLSWSGTVNAATGGALRAVTAGALVNGKQVVPLAALGDQFIAQHQHDYKLAVSINNDGTLAASRLYGVRLTYTMNGPNPG